jgi:ornithine carbamoyltransferase
MTHGPDHLLTIADLTADDVSDLFRLAETIKQETKRKLFEPRLAHKNIGLLFTKSSTRTRISFEVGISQMGGHAVVLNGQEMQLGRGEDIEDTAKVVSRYLDGMMIRTYAHEDVVEFARCAGIPVINGLTDLAHPCQVLTDLFTLREKGIDIQTARIVFLGDCNNVTYSWLTAAGVLGLNITVISPPDYRFAEEQCNAFQDRARAAGGTVVFSSDTAAVKDADVVYTDTWVSMGQEAEKEKRMRDFLPYQVNPELLSRIEGEYVVMHDLPAYKGCEITAEVMRSPQSIIFDQAENRLHLQKGILARLLAD